MTTTLTTAASPQARFPHLLRRTLASTEAANCYCHLHTFFARHWEDGHEVRFIIERAEVEKDNAIGGADR